jgi:hypothetical protein
MSENDFANIMTQLGFVNLCGGQSIGNESTVTNILVQKDQTAKNEFFFNVKFVDLSINNGSL